ncbi:T9SS type A sorting domain-containing protein [Ferruginibacter lapsinanis]|uniref:T9SS type A sorting domain-containing protein n=1 Tax=Ferruginibacter lapsinanis TaxID=563172 RepID=UPI001E4A3FBA|nr:T9SS type A sorting domain-containing protein [Ferruginibacter lapsinanis]UEG50168.1 T9SS type A sorting domain-containing protein [Ferruginibacter lapsinanis]
MKIFTPLKNGRLKFYTIFIILCSSIYSTAQVIRPYNQIYSNSLKGGHIMFGNTSMRMDSANGDELLYRMNDYGNYANGTTSQYGNDNSNMQFVDIDGGGTPVSLVSYGSSWNYSNANSQPAGWPNVTTLAGGPGSAPLGYGPTGGVNTTLTDRRTYYFTKTINFDPADHDKFIFELNLDDGAVVYVNGIEVGRINMNVGTPDYNTDAMGDIEPETITSFTVPSGAPFVNGNNTIQVEVHTSASNESGTDDLFFDLQLTGSGLNPTFNSSSADLVLPAGTNTIKYARLYWGGRITSGMSGADNINLRTILIRKGNAGPYTTGIAPSGQVDKASAAAIYTDSAYQSYVDITGFISSNGAGTYTVANVTAATGSRNSGGFYAGWSIVVVYENPTSTYSSVRIYDGFLQVYSGGNVTTQSITLTGLNAPSTPLNSSDAYMTTMAWEGDANLAASVINPDGDFMKLNNITVTNAHNPATNFWNGTITENGVDVTTKFPNYINQFGLDLDETDVGTGFGIVPNATQATVEFGTEADQYFPSVFAFTMKTKEPSIFIDKAVSDAIPPFHALTTNEILTYTLSGSNVGIGAAYKCTVIDTIPSNVTFVSGSLEVLASPGGIVGSKTDNAGDDVAFKGTVGSKTYVKFYIGTGATSSEGGVLESGENYSVRFKVITPAIASQVTTVANLVRIMGEGISGDQYVDDATAIIGPEGGSLAVKMSSFNVFKENGNAVLRWTTVSEDNNDHFEVEQSFDGINFYKVGTIAGNGTSQLVNNYQFINILYNNAVSVVYYRLKIYDRDDNISLTKIIALRLSGEEKINQLNIYPNPFVHNIKIQLHSDNDQISTIRIVNISGQVAIKRSIGLQAGENIIVLKDLEVLPKGTYTVEVQTQSGTQTQRIIKN